EPRARRRFNPPGGGIMKRMQRIIVASVSTLALAACESKQPMAADPAQFVQQRQDLMKDNGMRMKAINDFVESGKGTPADVKMHAEAIQANALKIEDLFPAGTSAEDLPGKSYAKPDIWAKWPEFEKTAYLLEEQAEALADIAGDGNVEAIKTQFASVGKNACGACHQAFRLKKE
ncbi:MAG: c-type cytochrome, partial [Dongiaceae bacterium]